MQLKLTGIVAGFALASATGLTTVAQADIIALYDFGTVDTPTFASSDIEPNSLATAFSVNPQTLGTTGTWNGATNGLDLGIGNPAPSWAQKPRGGLDQAAAYANNSYVTFTVSPSVGASLNLVNFTFGYTLANSGRPINYYLASDIDGFDTPIGSAVTGLTTNGSANVSLTGTQFQAVTNPIVFRLYLWDNALGGSSGSAWRFDNFTLNGTVVPEPASLALLCIGGFMFIPRRRHA